eukprot:CAMPEP_0183350116 /NCGR_PEP_ID=MMETSP0164_2-20130417/16820_1 /TAXON_ID=221442 /ORGANISM="Coccolithus pelagicus ssp braarudi, Strain PLY182g" /LENGTH=74 /DNA_ID=CAMNT_0025521987 /DNA_START=18 /DNA_END=238 /DNA_ORIENTATION=-
MEACVLTTEEMDRCGVFNVMEFTDEQRRFAMDSEAARAQIDKQRRFLLGQARLTDEQRRLAMGEGGGEHGNQLA